MSKVYQMWSKKNVGTTVATYSLLTLVGAVSFSLPNALQTVHAAPLANADQIRIYGVVRDFYKGNIAFKTVPSGGNGHYAGNIGTTLGADDRPTYSGAGFKVSAQWHDKNGNQIAPHMFSDAYTLRLVTAPSMDQGTVMDTWDSSIGAYGGANIGPAPSIMTGCAMPVLTAPTNLGPSVGDVNYTVTPKTLNANIHCNNFLAKQSMTFNVTAPVTILCEADFKPDKINTFNIMPGGSLTIYVKGLFKINQTTKMNMNTWNPSLLKVYNLGTTQMEINQSSQFCGQIVTPNAQLHLAQSDQFYGSFTGLSVDIDQNSGFHLDKSIPKDYCNVVIADTMGTRGANSNGGLVSALKFADWFNDVPGTNSGISSPIILTKDSNGVYEFLSDDYHPIDNQGFGNEGEAHNNYISLSIAVQFTHHACTNGFVEFQGCDDAWLFINRQLALDLGGMVPNMLQHVDVDRFALVDGQKYYLHFFYAQRQPNMAVFKFRTNLDLDAEVVAVPVTAMYD